MNDITSASPEPVLPVTEETTMQDLQLAERLGYKRLADIRKLIKRHQPSLEAIGPLRHRGAMVGIGSGASREVTEFHLTKAQATFLIAKAGTKEADSALILVSEAFAMLMEDKLVVVDEAAQAELDAAAARAAERRRLMREEKDDYSRIMKGFDRSLSRSVVGHKPDGTPILRELTPFEKQREERQATPRRGVSPGGLRRAGRPGTPATRSEAAVGEGPKGSVAALLCWLALQAFSARITTRSFLHMSHEPGRRSKSDVVPRAPVICAACACELKVIASQMHLSHTAWGARPVMKSFTR